MKLQRLALSSIASLSLGLWVGGLVMLFMSVSSLFATYARPTAGLGATEIFHRFEIYQLVLAAIAMTTTWLSVRPGRARWIAMGLLVTCAAAALVITFAISPRINAMRMAGETETPTFRAMHGAAMATYLLVTHLVAAALITVTVSWRAETSARGFAGPTSPAAPAGSPAVR